MFNLSVCLLTMQKVAFLLLVILLGYRICRSGKIERKSAQTLSILTTHIFSPAYSLYALPKNFTVENLGSNLAVLGLGALLLIPTIFLSRLMAKSVSRTEFEKKSLSYIFAFANTGYFGYPVIEGVFGPEILSQFMVFCMPFNVALNSYGYSLFMENRGRIQWKKVLFSPVMLGYYGGIVLGLFGINLSGFLGDAVKGLGACMSPASMLSAGIVLGSFPLKKLLSGVRPYLYGLIRLVGIPLLFGVPLYLLGLRGIYLALPMAAFSMPVGLNTVVFPESFGKDASDNAKLCFVSFIMSILFLPVVFAVASAAAGL